MSHPVLRVTGAGKQSVVPSRTNAADDPPKLPRWSRDYLPRTSFVGELHPSVARYSQARSRSHGPFPECIALPPSLLLSECWWLARIVSDAHC
jgi:hypothetical protein